MYVTQLESKKVKESQVEPFMHRSLGEYPHSYAKSHNNKQIPQNYLVSHPLFAPSREAAQARNAQLNNSNEERRIYLWKRT